MRFSSNIASALTFNKSSRLTLVLFAVALLLAVSPDRSWAQSSENQIRVTGDEFDFGYIPFGTSVKHTLYIENDADTSLRITKVNPGCGCTTIPLKTREVGPGETLEVDLILDTGKIHPGDFKKGPRIYTDSRLRPQIVCSLTGKNFKEGDSENQQILEVEPASLMIRKDRTSDSATIILKNTTKLTLIPRVIELPLPELISVDVPARAIIPGRALEIGVKLNDIHAEKGDVLLESITVSFNDPGHTRLTIPIKVIK